MPPPQLLPVCSATAAGAATTTLTVRLVGSDLTLDNVQPGSDSACRTVISYDSSTKDVTLNCTNLVVGANLVYLTASKDGGCNQLFGSTDGATFAAGNVAFYVAGRR
jgi:hypothetical protein